MKAFHLFLVCTALSLLFFLTYACNKKKSPDSPAVDSSKPMVTLKGDAMMIVPKGTTVADPGATAIDDVDGDISSAVKSNWSEVVKFNETGNYNVVYSVSDKSGNQGTATRVVTVKNSPASMIGTCDSQYASPYGGTGVFTSTITAGDNPNQIVVFPFRAGAIYMKMDMGGALGNDLTYSQTDFGINTAGTGTITDGGKTVLLTFTATGGGGSPLPFTGTLTLK